MSTIRITSNIKQFRKKLNTLPKLIGDETQKAMKEILEKMCQEMKDRLASHSQYWIDNGGLEVINKIDGNQDIEYEINDNIGRIYVGRNTRKLVMKDGRAINPYLFIEFGYGIIGENNPNPNAYLQNWQYNVNDHEKAWVYTGINGEPVWTMGQRGFDFFYPVIDKYRKEWKNIVSKRILKLSQRW